MLFCGNCGRNNAEHNSYIGPECGRKACNESLEIHFHEHIKQKSEEAEKLGLEIGSTEHHKFVFGSYKLKLNQ